MSASHDPHPHDMRPPRPKFRYNSENDIYITGEDLLDADVSSVSGALRDHTPVDWSRWRVIRHDSTDVLLHVRAKLGPRPHHEKEDSDSGTVTVDVTNGGTVQQTNECDYTEGAEKKGSFRTPDPHDMDPPRPPFRYKNVNQIFITGDNMAGARVYRVYGKLDNGEAVTWSEWEPVGSATEHRFHIKAKLGDRPRHHERDGADSGTVTVDLSDDGSIQQQNPCDYGP